jgi:ectoine hydroxylase-related dioxygenase (phytanoyl-CoA dioxygenase family)
MSLAPDQIAAFHHDGYLAPLRVLRPTAAARVRAAFDALEQREGREKAQIGLVDRHFDEPFIMELATHPAIVEAVTALIGPDVLLLATHFFCKYPSAEQADAGERFVAWHQDVTYWGLEPPIAITAWYAVDDSDAENGCMRAIPGSHRGGIRPHGKAGEPGNLLSVNQQVPVTAEEEATAIDLPLHAGEISLHDGALIHGSLPNRSSRRRCGLTLRYVPAHVRRVAPNSTTGKWRTVQVDGVHTTVD